MYIYIEYIIYYIFYIYNPYISLLPQNHNTLLTHPSLAFIPSSYLPYLSVPDYRPFLAGGICAACSHGWTTPIDVVKTKIQSDPKKVRRCDNSNTQNV